MKDRLKELLAKLLSIKGIVFIIATVLMFMGKVTPHIWGISALILIGIRTLEKVIRAVWPGVKK